MTFSKNSELIFLVKWYIDSIDSYYQYPKLFEKIIQKFLRKLWYIGHSNIFFSILGQLKILLSHSVLFSMLKRWFQQTSGAAEIFKSNFPSSIGMHLQQKLFRKIFLFACQIRLSVVDKTLVLSFLKKCNKYYLHTYYFILIKLQYNTSFSLVLILGKSAKLSKVVLSAPKL